MNYATPYPYTFTIFTLLSITSLFLIAYKNKINWYRYNCGLIFTFIFGVAQIHGCVNVPNIPAWEFPEGSAFFTDIGWGLGKIAFEDLLFIPVCYTLFYGFMFLIRKTPDFLSGHIKITTLLLSSFVIIEALLYQAGGEAAQILILIYTFIPLSFFAIYILKNKVKINSTHVLLSLIFVFFVNCGWELINAWRYHWFYNEYCEIFSRRGFFEVFGRKLHISIFIQYAISGFCVMYSSWVIFEKKDKLPVP